MQLRMFVVVFIAVLASGCVTSEEQRARDEAKCRSYGFAKRNDAFAECMQRIDIARQANYRVNAGVGWDDG